MGATGDAAGQFYNTTARIVFFVALLKTFLENMQQHTVYATIITLMLGSMGNSILILILIWKHHLIPV